MASRFLFRLYAGSTAAAFLQQLFFSCRPVKGDEEADEQDEGTCNIWEAHVDVEENPGKRRSDHIAKAHIGIVHPGRISLRVASEF